MAKLYKRGTCYYLGWYQDGQRYRRSLGKVEAETAKALQAEKEAELAGLIAPRSGLTASQVIDDYLKWYECARPTSYKRARSAVKKFKAVFGNLSAEGIDPRMVEAWETTEKYRSAANHAVKIAKTAFRRGMRVGILRTNPMEVVQPSAPPISRAPDYFKPKQLERLYKTARGPVWRLMANTGIRRGEMFKARRSDVRDGKLYVESVAGGRTKSGKWRAVPLNVDARSALRNLSLGRLVNCDHVDTLSDWFREDATAAKVRGTLHWLRHTFCTALVQSGVSLYDVKVLAGHSSITVTERYAHHAPGIGKAAVASIEKWSRGHTLGHTRPKRKAARR